MKRGQFQFEVTDAGNLMNSAQNVEALRRLWLDRILVSGGALGPGDDGDFDNGAWHVSCHLAGAGGVARDKNGKLVWVEISHDPVLDEYYGSITFDDPGRPKTLRLDSEGGQKGMQESTLLGYVEGNSTGHISARNVNDSRTIFNRWRRQDFNQPINSSGDGGKVWEHWCTLRDIRPEARIGLSVVKAYVSLVSVLGDRFAPTVARGRRDYSHPKQLVALVRAGFVGEPSALWDTKPVRIPAEQKELFLSADPMKCLEAANLLDWRDSPKYFMYERRISHWSSASQVTGDLSPSS